MQKSNESYYSWKFRITLWLLFVVCRLLMMTWRIRVVGMDKRRKAIAENPRGSFVLATWHENAIAGVLSHPGQGIAVLCSQSKDGEIVAYIASRIGLKAVRGSSSRGGREARDDMIDLLRSGTSAAVTIDGPRGPRRKAKPGIVDVARKSGAAIVPITCIAKDCWTLSKTWDKTKIPKPFSKLLVHYGEPRFVSVDCEGEDFEQVCTVTSQTLDREDEMVRVNFDALWAKGKSFSA